MVLISSIFILTMGFLSYLAGKGTAGQVPEILFSLPFGISLGCAFIDVDVRLAIMLGTIGIVISYAGMQTGTWYYLRWQKHDNPNLKRGGTLKPLIDWISKRFGWKIGDEGYAWVAAAIKGFIIGLPVGGIPLAIMWPIAHETGTHFKVKNPVELREFLSGCAAGISILLFLWICDGCEL